MGAAHLDRPFAACRSNLAQGELSISHHYSGPDFGFPHGDARLDLTDLYAFSGSAGKSILIMNVHPSVALSPSGPTTDEPFSPDAIYELKIDTNGDAVADIAYRVRFSSPKNGAQIGTVRRVEGAEAAGIGDGGQTIIERAPVSTRREAQVTRLVTTASSPVGAAIPFSSTRWAPSTTCSSQATISSLGRMCAASRWKCLTLRSGRTKLASGIALWTVRTESGSRRIAAPYPRSRYCNRRAQKRIPRRGAGGRRPFRCLCFVGWAKEHSDVPTIVNGGHPRTKQCGKFYVDVLRVLPTLRVLTLKLADKSVKRF